jgi:hypothetical protein
LAKYIVGAEGDGDLAPLHDKIVFLATAATMGSSDRNGMGEESGMSPIVLMYTPVMLAGGRCRGGVS